MITIILDKNFKPKEDLSNVHPKVWLVIDGNKESYQTQSGETVIFKENASN